MGPLDQILALFEACPRPKPLSLSGSSIPCPIRTVEDEPMPPEKETLKRKPVSVGVDALKRRERRSPVPQRKRKWKSEQQRHLPPTQRLHISQRVLPSQRIPPSRRIPHWEKRKRKGKRTTKEEKALPPPPHSQQRAPFKPLDRRSIDGGMRKCRKNSGQQTRVL